MPLIMKNKKIKVNMCMCNIHNLHFLINCFHDCHFLDLIIFQLGVRYYMHLFCLCFWAHVYSSVMTGGGFWNGSLFCVSLPFLPALMIARHGDSERNRTEGQVLGFPGYCHSAIHSLLLWTLPQIFINHFSGFSCYSCFYYF